MAKNNIENNNDFEIVEDIFPEPWKDMDEGDFIIGKYLGTSLINGANEKPFTIYKLRNDDGELISVSGASLEARMVTIPVGTRLKITFKGTEKSKHGSGMKMFEVQAPKGTKYIEV
jgi:hypothetical protein